jgi:hypothetical protein
MAASVLKPEIWDANKHYGIRVYKGRMVREVKVEIYTRRRVPDAPAHRT